VIDSLLELHWRLRESVGKRLKLRPGLPPPLPASRRAPEIAFYGQLVERALGAGFPAGSVARVVDVGCRNWSYAPALARFFPRAALLGVELDGGRRYADLFRRMDSALSHAGELRRQGRDARCAFMDFRSVAPTPADGATVVCFFFPFVSRDPCRGWGLPSRHADFTSLLRAALAWTRPGDPLWILSTHQGHWERDLAEAAYREAGLETRAPVELPPHERAAEWPSPYSTWLMTASAAARTAAPGCGWKR
jgi:hypothetical protein